MPFEQGGTFDSVQGFSVNFAKSEIHGRNSSAPTHYVSMVIVVPDTWGVML